MSHNKEVAEELTQETFYRAIKNIHTFRGECSIDVWLCQIAKNVYYKEYAKQKKRKTVPIEELHDAENILENLEETFFVDEEKKWLYQEIQNLSEIEKHIVLLRITAELSFKQIGCIVGQSENYVRVHFYRAKHKLKNLQHTLPNDSS